MLKILFTFIAIIISVSCFAQSVTFKNLNIVCPSDAIPAEVTAAKELQKYLTKITKENIVITDTKKDQAYNIYIGLTDTTNKVSNFNFNELKKDGIYISIKPDFMVLAGNRKAGTLYAVYEFLEKYLNCKFYAVDEEIIPTKTNIKLSVGDYSYSPQIFYREPWYYKVVRNRNNDFQAKMRVNGHFADIPDEWGSSNYLLGWCHTFSLYMNPDVYFDSHPDWFAERDGKREKPFLLREQPCLTNKEMQAEMIKNILKTIKENPNTTVVSVSQNDNNNYCTCKNCTAFVKEHGNQADLLINYVNEVADAITKVYPNIIVETLAYSYTVEPPKTIRPNKNLLIRLCSEFDNVNTNINDPKHKKFADSISAWKKMTNNLYHWDYICNITQLQIPFPNQKTVLDDIKIFANNNMVGTFLQGDYWNKDISFADMRIWTSSKMLWNPTLNSSALIKEFMTAYYKESSTYMIDIYSTYEDLYKNYDLSILQMSNNTFKPEDYIKLFRLFNAAQKTAKSDVIKNRVSIERRSLEMSFLLNSAKFQNKVYSTGVIKKIDGNQWAEDYLKWAKETSNLGLAEVKTLDMGYFIGTGIYKIPKSKKIPEFCKNIPDENWFELQDVTASLAGEGTEVFRIDDPDASDGKALKMPGKFLNWSIQMSLLGAASLGFNDVDVYITVKGKKSGTTGGNGTSLGCGVHDQEGGPLSGGGQKILTLDEMPTEYKDIYVGRMKITKSSYFWFSHPNNPDLDYFMVDRVILVKK